MFHLGKPKKVLGDGGGAALNLHQWDLIFSGHQDVLLVIEHSSQVHAPNYIHMRESKQRENRNQIKFVFTICILYDVCYLCGMFKKNRELYKLVSGEKGTTTTIKDNEKCNI